MSFSTGQATVAAALIALFSAVAGGIVQGYFNRDVEADKNAASIKLEQKKFETTLIFKATETPERSAQIRNLKFFVAAGFISDPDGKIARMSESAYPSTPPASPAASIGVDAQLSTSPLAKRASIEALNVLLTSEIGSQAGYERHFSHPVMFSGSGVTIGIGYDLAYVTQDGFRDAWTGRLDPAATEILKQYVGIKDPPMSDSDKARLATVTVGWEAAVGVFLSKTMPEYDTRLHESLENVDELPPEAHGALLLLIYNRGATFGVAGDRNVEMRAIRDAMAAKSFTQIPSQIRRMKRLWPNAPGMVKRREIEAELFEKGFAKANP